MLLGPRGGTRECVPCDLLPGSFCTTGKADKGQRLLVTEQPPLRGSCKKAQGVMTESSVFPKQPSSLVPSGVPDYDIHQCELHRGALGPLLGHLLILLWVELLWKQCCLWPHPWPTWKL